MTIFDRMLQSRNAALYRMMWYQQHQQRIYPVGGEGKTTIVPDVIVDTQDAIIDAIDSAAEKVTIALSQPIALQNDPIVVPEGKTVTIDINGNALDSTGLNNTTTKDALLAVRRGGTLVLEDSKVTGVVDGSKVGSIYAALKLTEKGEDADGDEAAKVIINSGNYKFENIVCQENGKYHISNSLNMDIK